MKITLNINPVTNENTNTGNTMKFEGGSFEFEMSPEEFATSGTTIIKSLPMMREAINFITETNKATAAENRAFQAAEAEKQRQHEKDMLTLREAVASDSMNKALGNMSTVLGEVTHRVDKLEKEMAKVK